MPRGRETWRDLLKKREEERGEARSRRLGGQGRPRRGVTSRIGRSRSSRGSTGLRHGAHYTHSDRGRGTRAASSSERARYSRECPWASRTWMLSAEATQTLPVPVHRPPRRRHRHPRHRSRRHASTEPLPLPLEKRPQSIRKPSIRVLRLLHLRLLTRMPVELLRSTMILRLVRPFLSEVRCRGGGGDRHHCRRVRARARARPSTLRPDATRVQTRRARWPLPLVRVPLQLLIDVDDEWSPSPNRSSSSRTARPRS